MFRSIMCAIALALCAAAPALAQDSGEDEEVVVTGSRLAYYSSIAVPHVFVTRRADFAIVEVDLRNDTRAADMRRGELVEALNRLQAAAARANMTLALVDDDNGIVRQYTLAGAQQSMESGGRTDTTQLEIRVRTAVASGDTLDSIHDRVAHFVEALPKPGRVELTVGRTDLTMVNLEQYRDGMVRDILAEGRALSAQVGGAQQVGVGGLESQVAFHRTGDMDLVLFLPYTLSLNLAGRS
jgi:hypothetical protein